jgi:hypothetical protein
MTAKPTLESIAAALTAPERCNELAAFGVLAHLLKSRSRHVRLRWKSTEFFRDIVGQANSVDGREVGTPALAD